MCLRFLELLIVLSLFVGPRSHAADSPRPILRIAADPNNLPFSNQQLEGFENKIAQIVASELGAEIQYVWRAQRRGFFRETLKAGACDLVMGVPAGFDMALTTAPYYRSSYVFVYPQGRPVAVTSFDDASLHSAKIGIQLVGDDGVDTPPAHALARRGLITNVVGFTLYGDYREANPPARIMDALASGLVDVAVVWGPTAGYFAKHSATPVQVVPVSPASEPPLRYAFNIAMGVRRSDRGLRDRLNEVIARRQSAIDAILDSYGVPRLPIEKKQTSPERKE
jgi:mxaJ protein